MNTNCWEHMSCGREPGGLKVEQMGVCPAAEDSDLNGFNDGDKGGRMCWALAGTFCGGERQGSFTRKVTACLDCDFFAKVKQEEGADFSFLVPGKEFEEISHFLAEIKRQEATIAELATPIIPLFDRIIAMPLVGVVDTARAKELMRALLRGIRQYRAKLVILDVTGVPLVDTAVADHLHKTLLAARLKGVDTIVTGISDAVAETIVDLGVDWSSVRTMSDLQVGLVEALHTLGYRLTSDDASKLQSRAAVRS